MMAGKLCQYGMLTWKVFAELVTQSIFIVILHTFVDSRVGIVYAETNSSSRMCC